MSSAPFEVPKAHRWFAVEFNNLAWDLAEAPARTPEEVDRMLLAAHASCWHWLQVGTALNYQRGYLLVAYACALAGLGDSAVRWVERCLALSEANGDEQTPFDRATTYDTAARAYHIAGNEAAARPWLEKSRAAAKNLVDPDDLAVFEKLRFVSPASTEQG